MSASAMSVLIVIVGLAICCGGVLLSWHKKGGISIWSTFVFGFLLVVAGGPLHDSISGLSVSGDGLELKFDKVSVSQEEQKAVEGSIRESLSSASPAQAEQAGTSKQQLLDVSSDVVLDQLLPFIRSLGFVPTQIIGTSKLQPGSIVAIANGRLTVLAAFDEAFPQLPMYHSNVAFPQFMSQKSTSAGGRIDKIDAAFRCSNGAEIIEASLVAFQGTAKATVVKQALAVPGAYLVQSILRCNGLELKSEKMGANGDAEKSQREDEYYAKDDIAIGYKLLEIKVQK